VSECGKRKLWTFKRDCDKGSERTAVRTVRTGSEWMVVAIFAPTGSDITAGTSRVNSLHDESTARDGGGSDQLEMPSLDMKGPWD
jgi:hypothetical protein